MTSDLPRGHDPYDAIRRRHARTEHEITAGLDGLRRAKRIVQVQLARLAHMPEDTRHEELRLEARLEELGRLIAAERTGR